MESHQKVPISGDVDGSLKSQNSGIEVQAQPHKHIGPCSLLVLTQDVSF
ncbi:hypothetical protein Ocin01_14845 [Orchesella cincta]|uniref:Uncharacterized protein n=1 Tax=Orchesella cincta TaxID=48709 RepID=A0A1D2MFS5_ORCCI|nr:hypothetical protein Ocin01_14845 [Orchesella cincta]